MTEGGRLEKYPLKLLVVKSKQTSTTHASMQDSVLQANSVETIVKYRAS
jgi:hypothetical protein